MCSRAAILSAYAVYNCQKIFIHRHLHNYSSSFSGVWNADICIVDYDRISRHVQGIRAINIFRNISANYLYLINVCNKRRWSAVIVSQLSIKNADYRNALKLIPRFIGGLVL